MKNIKKAQNKQSKYFDKKHGAGSPFVVGAPVLKKNLLRKKKRDGSLDFRWEGPFKISKSLGRGLYKLEEINGGMVRVNVHICSEL